MTIEQINLFVILGAVMALLVWGRYRYERSVSTPLRHCKRVFRKVMSRQFS